MSTMAQLKDFVIYRKNIFTVQFHPEACAGPKDSEVLFDEFIKMMEE